MPEKSSGRAPGQWLTARTDKVLLGVAACVSMCSHSSLLLTLLLIFFSGNQVVKKPEYKSCSYDSWVEGSYLRIQVISEQRYENLL